MWCLSLMHACVPHMQNQWIDSCQIVVTFKIMPRSKISICEIDHDKCQLWPWHDKNDCTYKRTIVFSLAQLRWNAQVSFPDCSESPSELLWSPVVGRLSARLCFHICIFFFRTTGPISTKLGTRHPWVKGIQVCSNEGLRPFPRGDNNKIAKTYWRN